MGRYITAGLILILLFGAAVYARTVTVTEAALDKFAICFEKTADPQNPLVNVRVVSRDKDNNPVMDYRLDLWAQGSLTVGDRNQILAIVNRTYQAVHTALGVPTPSPVPSPTPSPTPTPLPTPSPTPTLTIVLP